MIMSYNSVINIFTQFNDIITENASCMRGMFNNPEHKSEEYLCRLVNKFLPNLVLYKKMYERLKSSYDTTFGILSPTEFEVVKIKYDTAFQIYENFYNYTLNKTLKTFNVKLKTVQVALTKNGDYLLIDNVTVSKCPSDFCLFHFLPTDIQEDIQDTMLYERRREQLIQHYVDRLRKEVEQ